MLRSVGQSQPWWGSVEYNPLGYKIHLCLPWGKNVPNFRMEGSRAKWWLENMERQAGQECEPWSEERTLATVHWPYLLQMAVLAPSPVLKWPYYPIVTQRATLEESLDPMTWKICPVLLYNQTGHRIIHFHYSIWKHSWNLRQKDPYQVIWAFLRFPCCHTEKLLLILKYFTKKNLC